MRISESGSVCSVNRRRRRRWLRWALVGAAGLLLAAVAVCVHSGFGWWSGDSRGRQAASPAADPLAGQWQGRWASTSSAGRGGQLRCEIRKLDETHYQADFHAQFASVLSNDTSVTLIVRRDGGVWHFGGERDLGLLKGGLYRYVGRVTDGSFVATYDSKFDRGEFRMTRPAAAAASQPASKPSGRR